METETKHKTIKEALAFVRGSVAKKALSESVQQLTHYHIKEGRIYGSNGVLAVSHPIPLNLTASPKAAKFFAAINNVKGAASMRMTPAGRLVVKSGAYRAVIDCYGGDVVPLAPSGTGYRFAAPLLPVLKKLAPFISEDASRPWSRGILLEDQSAFATNNLVLVQHWLGGAFPIKAILPQMAVAELLRIGTEPTYMLVEENHISFMYGETGAAWLRTQLINAEFPDLTKVLDVAAAPAPIPEGLFPALEEVKPFLGKLAAVYFKDGSITTDAHDGVERAEVVVDGLPAKGAYIHKCLAMLDGVATSIDFSNYPKPAIFHGDGLRGAISTVRTT